MAMAIALLFPVLTLLAEEGAIAVINDRDGYTNIRRSPGKAEIIGKVIENEQFTVYPNETAWWRIRTSKGLEGFIHRSCVRLLDDAASGDQKISARFVVSRDEATLKAWTQYVAIQESERSHEFSKEDVIIREAEKIPLEGVDPIVVAHITAALTMDKNVIAMHNRVQAALRQVKPMVALRESLRPSARTLGGKLMEDRSLPEPFRRDAGEATGELLLLYCFSDATKVDLPDRTQILMDHDRLLVEEGLINAALGIDNGEGLNRQLGRVRDRAFAARFQSGRWILRDAAGDIADLEMTSDTKAAWNAGGWVTVKWRRRGGGEARFQYEFSADGAFRLWDKGMGALLMGDLAPPPRVVKAAFIRPTVLKVIDEKGELMGTWEQISPK
jgi:hypothetical protein